MDEVDRHALRIQVKKMRYAVEFLSGVFPDEADKQKRFAADVEDLQEELGKLNDLVTARELAMADSSAQTEEEVEAEHLAEAEHHARDLIALGPFWRRERIREWGGWLLRAVDRTKARSAPRHASRRR
jgi:CHAD domain-containing protein